jgi:hypothetical protein
MTPAGPPELLADFAEVERSWGRFAAGWAPWFPAYAAGWYAARAGVPCPPQGQRGQFSDSFARGYGDGERRGRA